MTCRRSRTATTARLRTVSDSRHIVSPGVLFPSSIASTGTILFTPSMLLFQLSDLGGIYKRYVNICRIYQGFSRVRNSSCSAMDFTILLAFLFLSQSLRAFLSPILFVGKLDVRCRAENSYVLCTLSSKAFFRFQTLS